MLENLIKLYNKDVYPLEKNRRKNEDISYVTSKLESEVFDSIVEKFCVSLHHAVKKHFEKGNKKLSMTVPVIFEDDKIYIYEKSGSEKYLVYTFDKKKEKNKAEDIIEELHLNSEKILKKTINLLSEKVSFYSKNLNTIEEILEEKRKTSIKEFNLDYHSFIDLERLPLLSSQLYKNGSYYSLSLFGYRISLKDPALSEKRIFSHKVYSKEELTKIIDSAIEEIISKVNVDYESKLLRKVKQELIEKYNHSEYDLKLLKVNNEISCIKTNFKEVEIPMSLTSDDLATLSRFIKIVNHVESSNKDVRMVFKHLYMADEEIKMPGAFLPKDTTIGEIVELTKIINQDIVSLERALKYSVYPEGSEQFYYSKAFFANTEGTFEKNGVIYKRINFRLPGCMKTKMIAFKIKNKIPVRISNNSFFKVLRKGKMGE